MWKSFRAWADRFLSSRPARLIATGIVLIILTWMLVNMSCWALGAC